MWLCQNQVRESHSGHLCCPLTMETRNSATRYRKIRRTVTFDTPEPPEPGGDSGRCYGYGVCWFHVNEGRTKCIDYYHSGMLALRIIC